MFPLQARARIMKLSKKLKSDLEEILWAEAAVVTRNFQGKMSLIFSFWCT